MRRGAEAAAAATTRRLDDADVARRREPCRAPPAPNNATSAAAAPITPSAGPSTGGFIQADPSTNSLIITAPEPLYRQVRTMIDQLDERRAQVYIESLIVEVTGDNAADFGFQWQGLFDEQQPQQRDRRRHQLRHHRQPALDHAGAARGGHQPAARRSDRQHRAASRSAKASTSACVHNFFGTYGLAAIARLLQSQTNTNIASTPNMVTLDNEEAKIVVGSNVPFVTGQFTQTGGAVTNPFQTIERKDVGITLRIRPQIGENGTIRMTIFQEASSLSQQVAPGTSNAGPSTNKRSIESNVVVDDGQIIVLGGLIEDRYTDNKSKVPLLGDIPYLGALFRSESRTKTRTNLMVFLRPVVMRDAETTNTRLARALRADPRLPARDAADAERAGADQRVAGDRADAPRRKRPGQLSAPQSSPGTTKPIPAAGRPTRRCRSSCR